MGCVTTLQWERLFPERIDFLILRPLPLRPRTLFSAKLLAVAGFLSLFLFAANVCATVLIPALAQVSVWRAMAAHALAVFVAGASAALAVLALEAAVIALTPARWYRRVAPLTQTVLITAFLTLFLRYATVSGRLSLLLDGTVPLTRLFPPLWFTSVYEIVLGGRTATGFAHTLARDVWLCFPLLFACVAVLYPLAWVRRHRMALEGARSMRLRDSFLWSAVAHRTVLRKPGQRAVFHFIRQTLTRLSRHHTLLAFYSGAGLALCLALAVDVQDAGQGLRLSVWHTGASLALPVLLFWLISGLRVAFLLPEELPARWILRLAPLRTREVVSTVKRFVFLIALCVTFLVCAGLHVCA